MLRSCRFLAQQHFGEELRSSILEKNCQKRIHLLAIGSKRDLNLPDLVTFVTRESLANEESPECIVVELRRGSIAKSWGHGPTLFICDIPDRDWFL
jgi:hypothetical protein